MDESGVRKLLDNLAEAPRPPSAVDVAHAIKVGHRRIDRRRTLVAATAVAAICGLVGGAFALRAPRPEQQVADGLALPTVQAFDPLVRYASFGWLPDGMNLQRLEATTDHQETRSVLAPAEATPDHSVTLRLVPAGYEIAKEVATAEFVRPASADLTGLTSAAPVNGHEAFWTDSLTDANSAALRWRTAMGGWAEVFQENVVGDPKAVARKIAEQVRFEQAPILLPARVKPSAGRALIGVRLDDDPSGPADFWARLDFPDAVVEVSKVGQNDQEPWPLTVEGKPARVKLDIFVQILERPGIKVSINVPGGGKAQSLGKVAEVYRDMEFFPDRPDWK